MSQIKKCHAAQARLVGAALALASLGGCMVAPVQGYPVAPGYAVEAPPPLQPEVIGVAPAPGWFWISGFWGWGGGRYMWHPGYWQAPRPGYHWVPHTWQRDRGGWRGHGGHWDHDRR